MKTKCAETLATDARTNQKVEPLTFDVDSHEDYLRLRQAFAAMPKIPTLLHVDDAPTAAGPNRSYNWLLTSEQSGGSIAIHVLTVAPGSTRANTIIPPRRNSSSCSTARSRSPSATRRRSPAGAPRLCAARCDPCLQAARRPALPHPALEFARRARAAGAGLQRLALAGRTGAEAGRKVREDHEYFFHEDDAK